MSDSREDGRHGAVSSLSDPAVHGGILDNSAAGFTDLGDDYMNEGLEVEMWQVNGPQRYKISSHHRGHPRSPPGGREGRSDLCARLAALQPRPEHDRLSRGRRVPQRLRSRLSTARDQSDAATSTRRILTSAPTFFFGIEQHRATPAHRSHLLRPGHRLLDAKEWIVSTTP